MKNEELVKIQPNRKFIFGCGKKKAIKQNKWK